MTRPEQIKFKYQLVGLNYDWINAGTRRTAYYSYIPPGEYTFRVMETPIKIIMADDHPIVLQGFRRMIETDNFLLIVAEANDGETALELILQHQPAVAVLDIDMPKMDGFEVVRELKKRKIPIEIIFLTMHSEEELFQAAMDLGVKGYILKDGAVGDIISAI